jgi:type I restriction-modification system DNA methylase subunit
MSNIYEHLIRRFGAEVNEGVEDFMTPRDVVHLATALVLDPDDQLFEANPGLIRTLYDPTCGTGGFLTDAMNHVAEYSNRSKAPPILVPYGQELEPETHAVAVTGMLLRTLESDPGRDLSKNIAGPFSTLSRDAFAGQRFHYCLSNPPFGKKWEKDQPEVEAEHKRGEAGRFGPGLPRINDGSMLFLMHLASKLERPENGGGRAAILLSGSPLFNGGAGSGESEIRRWLLENDLVDAIVALPTEIFFRTGIGTYLWILSNKKPENRQGKVQLIDASSFWTSIKNEGNKRRIISDAQRDQIVCLYADGQDAEHSRMVDYRTFGYRRIRVLRPLRMVLRFDEGGLTRLRADKQWAKLSSEQQTAWEAALSGAMGQDRAESIFTPLQLHKLQRSGRCSAGAGDIHELYDARQYAAVRARPVRADYARVNKVQRANTLQRLRNTQERVAVFRGFTQHRHQCGAKTPRVVRRAHPRGFRDWVLCCNGRIREQAAINEPRRHRRIVPVAEVHFAHPIRVRENLLIAHLRGRALDSLLRVEPAKRLRRREREP